MNTILIGLNHKTAHISIREKIHFPTDKIPQALKSLMKFSQINSCVILSTCNRTEIYAAVENIEIGYNDIIMFISKYHNINQKDFISHIYKKCYGDAVVHLFKVVSSLDSMVIGEYQIQGQVRDAYNIAKENNCTQSLLNKLFQTAIQVGKKIRSQTNIGQGKVSVSSVAVDMVKKIFPNSYDPPAPDSVGIRRAGLKILLIGAGKISELTAANLKHYGNCNILVSNRSKDKAEELAAKFNANVISFNNRYDAMIKSDVVIVSTNANKYVVKEDIFKKIFNRTNKRKIFFIDLSVPRNIDPAINNIQNVISYSIDDLQNHINCNFQKRTDEIQNVEKIVTELSEDYFDWHAKQTIIPVMKEIREEFDDLSLQILNSYKSDLNAMTESQKKIMNEILQNYSEKLIKTIMKNLKKIINVSELAGIARTLKESFSVNK